MSLQEQGESLVTECAECQDGQERFGGQERSEDGWFARAGAPCEDIDHGP